MKATLRITRFLSVSAGWRIFKNKRSHNAVDGAQVPLLELTIPGLR